MPVAVELADKSPQALAQLDVDARGGLVEDDHWRLVHQRLSDEHPALHASGQCAHIGIGLRSQIEVMQDLVDPRIVVGETEVACLNPERFANGEKRVEHQFLRHHSEEPPRPAIIGHHVVPQHPRCPAIGAGKPRDD